MSIKHKLNTDTSPQKRYIILRFPHFHAGIILHFSPFYISHKSFEQMTDHHFWMIIHFVCRVAHWSLYIYTYTIENWLSSFGTSVNIWQLKQQNCFQSPLQSRVPVQHIQHRPTKETWYSWKPADGGLMGASRATHAQQIFAAAKFSKYSIEGYIVVSLWEFWHLEQFSNIPCIYLSRHILSIAVTPLDGGWR